MSIMLDFCDNCQNMLALISKYSNNSNQTEGDVDLLDRDDLNCIINYINIWSAKHCNCCYKDFKNFLGFDYLVQSVMKTSFELLKWILLHETTTANNNNNNNNDGKVSSSNYKHHQSHFDFWNQEDMEKLLQLNSKIFQLTFPLYVTYKHSTFPKTDELSSKEIEILTSFCDLTEYEIPIFLMRKIIYFIEYQGFGLFIDCFDRIDPGRLPISLANSMIATVQNLKYYFNVAINSELNMLRIVVIDYLCKIQDGDLRNVNNRAMFEYIWSVVKEYHLNHFGIDHEGLKIAFKYFTSSTLTMRLSGLSQINGYISIYNDLQQASMNPRHIEELTNWLIKNRIVENIFGPNSHVEVIKQSHFILNFLASKLTNEHIDIIWSAGQLKHYERYIFDILSQLIKNLKINTVYYLYEYLWKIKPKDHSEHTLNLAAQVIKYIWLFNRIQPDMLPANNTCSYLPGGGNGGGGTVGHNDSKNEFSSEAPMLGLGSPPIGGTAGNSGDGSLTKKNLSIMSSYLKSTDSRLISASKTNSSSASSIEVSDEEDEEDFDVSTMSGHHHHHQQRSDDNGNKTALEKIAADSEDCSINTSDGSDFEIEMSDGERLPKEDSFFKISAGGDPISVNTTGQAEPKNTDQPGETDSWRQSSDNYELMEISTSAANGDFKFRVADVYRPGNTLLWDILQDDMLNQMQEDIAVAAEKVFWITICCGSNREIRQRFIAGCLENLAKNSSVLTSIRLLQKLFSSFYQCQEGKLVRKIIVEAERQKNMLKSFFNNLSLYMSHYCNNGTGGGSRENIPNPLGSKFCSPKEEIQIRLNFLSFIFMYAGSHETLSFSPEHVNILWNIFTTCDCPEIVDEFFDWLLNQVKLNNDLNIDIIKLILFEKMPLLKPESFTLTSLELLQNLHGFILSKNCENPKTFSIVVKLLWDIAFNNPDADVSMNASRHLNNYYMNLLQCTNRFEKEEEFIRSCVGYLKDASLLLPISCQRSLSIIERAVILLKTYLEVFYARYSYFFRMLQLTSGTDTGVHRIRDKNEPMIRVTVTSPFNDKNTFEFSVPDHVGDLRAEIQHWWQCLSKSKKYYENEQIDPDECLVSLVLKDHEILFEHDEKRLLELNFKETQMNHIGFRVCKHTLTKSSNLARLSLSKQFFEEFRRKNPKSLLLEPRNFELLFILMQQLDMINTSNLKARILSRNIWEIVQLLPTSQQILNKFKLLYDRCSAMAAGDQQPGDAVIGTDQQQQLYQEIFPINSNQKLIYACQIVENYKKIHKHWAHIFLMTGGFKFLYKLLIDVVHSVRYKRDWTEWKQDCITSLVQILFQFAVFAFKKDDQQIDALTPAGSSRGTGTGPVVVVVMENRRSKRLKKSLVEKNLMLRYDPEFLAIIEDKEKLMDTLMTILNHVFLNSKLIYQTSIWSRAQVVFVILTFFTAWCYSDQTIFEMFFASPTTKEIIKKLILEDVDPTVRKETSGVFSRLFLSLSTEKCMAVLPKFLDLLLSFLEEAALINVYQRECNTAGGDCRSDNRHGGGPDELKENYGPGSKDYFVLVCRLIDHLYSQKLCTRTEIDAENLVKVVVEHIFERENFELRKNSTEDEGLKGLFLLLTVLMKNNPTIKTRSESKKLIYKIFDCLFALPTFQNRNLPKCKNIQTRTTVFELLLELVKGNEENYLTLTNLLIDQHSHEILGRTTAYPWDYWPHDESRSDFVGLTNLGATCYMASCMQHIFMLPEARYAILQANLLAVVKHQSILQELQRMFIYLQESERKAYNPKSFCKVYTMDHQPLNICEQKDMTEFFTDLITKLEEMTVDLKDMVKKHFSGLQSNNVVSLDCQHISQTMEEFYTLRCQVADMRDLYESLNELTVKDTLDGDNMYNCSECGRKVRAEKRACIKKLPKILCFNTMRYTFNMITMTKEKVNTHFSFPFKLDMAPYLERNLLNLPDERRGGTESTPEETSTKYDLIGVTVHTGTAEGGHYYSFIQDRDPASPTYNKWFLFNDAEVKLFDQAQIATECFGGEMTSKTYDKANDKFLDFSFEKTNSAYMLFYEKCEEPPPSAIRSDLIQKQKTSLYENVSKELVEWIWKDNISFIRDKLIFEHAYFDFVWQVCAQTPQTFHTGIGCNKATLVSIRLATLFVLETLIHAKEKPTMAHWIELLTKQFNNSPKACQWLMNHLSENDWWPVQILFKCSIPMVRQLFVRLCIHVIVKLKPVHKSFHSGSPTVPTGSNDVSSSSSSIVQTCVTSFVHHLISLIDLETLSYRPNIKYLHEYFSFLLEFAKQGDEECRFLLNIKTISIMIDFYLNHVKISTEPFEPLSDTEEETDFDGTGIGNAESSILRPHAPFRPGSEEKFPKLASLDKMISLIVYLLEKTQNRNARFSLTKRDFNALTSNHTFQFIQQQIRDNINLRQTFNLICSLCSIDDSLFAPIINMIFSSIIEYPDSSALFFKILSFLTDTQWVAPYLAKLILPKIWDLAEHTTLQTLEWLTQHVPRNEFLHEHVLGTLDHWVMYFLVENPTARIRTSCAQLLIALVPSVENSFRQNYRSMRSYPYTINKDIVLTKEGQAIVDRLFCYLLSQMKRAKTFGDSQQHGTQKLTSYFCVLTYLMVNTTQQRIFSQHFNDFWSLFHLKFSEAAISVHQNKQTLLMFWYVTCQEYRDAVKLIVQNPNVFKKIAFNYILADHEDQDVILFNRSMLPYYYGLLRFCCEESRSFTRYLSSHQNIQWAFKHISPYPNHYGMAVEELFELMRKFSAIPDDVTELELKEIRQFKTSSLRFYLQELNPSIHWSTMINAVEILMRSEEDMIFVIRHNGLGVMFQIFSSLHVMFHQATACHITIEMIDCLNIISLLLTTFEAHQNELIEFRSSVKNVLDVKKLLFLLNTYTPANVRLALFEVLLKLIRTFHSEYLIAMVKFLLFQHVVFVDQSYPFAVGPYFPKRGQKAFQTKSSLRPSRPLFQMCFNYTNLELLPRPEPEYEKLVYEFYLPYYRFVDDMCRFVIRYIPQNIPIDDLVELTLRLSWESMMFRCKIFIQLWLDVHLDQEYRCPLFLESLQKHKMFHDYLKIILIKERSFLEDEQVFELMRIFLSNTETRQKIVTPNILRNILSLIEDYSQRALDQKTVVDHLVGDLLVVKLILMTATTNNNNANDNSHPHNFFRNPLNRLKRFYSDFKPETHQSSNKEPMLPSQEKRMKMDVDGGGLTGSGSQTRELIAGSSRATENRPPPSDHNDLLLDLDENDFDQNLMLEPSTSAIIGTDEDQTKNTSGIISGTEDIARIVSLIDQIFELISSTNIINK